MSPPLERPRFFAGRLLTADDLSLEQNYFIEIHKRHNRSLHGFGIINGLKVNVGSAEITVEPGMALDCEGNEIVIETPFTITLPALTGNVSYLNLKFLDETITSGDPEPARFRESVEVTVGPQNCNQGHRHLRARWLACGKPHPFTIARLKLDQRRWRVDGRYRPPVIK